MTLKCRDLPEKRHNKATYIITNCVRIGKMKEEDKSIYYLTKEEIAKIDFSKITPESDLLNDDNLSFDIREIKRLETQKDD